MAALPPAAPAFQKAHIKENRGPSFFVTMLCVTNFLCVHYGVGKHLIAINPATAYEILHIGFFDSLC
ncbi:hypothetical protein HO133_005207 [Letharia lupina]|uniref:Uncharacterized protein n=1 Tax=Letharia lupina TaxID=560253 RepID=A0A8H6F8Y4_9LECA|nr:uncharacterized protein HO133_005207 [Letharia lupina]KAF6219381.1 hypothetical protein HO133_005207 [Letharia lupina]